jgi:hypothetical protein
LEVKGKGIQYFTKTLTPVLKNPIQLSNEWATPPTIARMVTHKPSLFTKKELAKIVIVVQHVSISALTTTTNDYLDMVYLRLRYVDTLMA